MAIPPQFLKKGSPKGKPSKSAPKGNPALDALKAAKPKSSKDDMGGDEGVC